MRVTREQAAANRRRIVDVAGRLFRERGFDGVGVDAIMQEAGLTHGGFYGHFASKEELATEAVLHGLAASLDKQKALVSLGAYVDDYLSLAHRDNPGRGCLMAALGGDIARQGGALRRGLAAHVQAQFGFLAALIKGRGARRRRQAVATLASLVGAIVLARAVDDPILSEEILAAVREELKGR